MCAHTCACVCMCEAGSGPGGDRSRAGWGLGGLRARLCGTRSQKSDGRPCRQEAAGRRETGQGRRAEAGLVSSPGASSPPNSGPEPGLNAAHSLQPSWVALCSLLCCSTLAHLRTDGLSLAGGGDQGLVALLCWLGRKGHCAAWVGQACLVCGASPSKPSLWPASGLHSATPWAEAALHPEPPARPQAPRGTTEAWGPSQQSARRCAWYGVGAQ